MMFYKAIIVLNWIYLEGNFHLEDKIPKFCYEIFERNLNGDIYYQILKNTIVMKAMWY